MIQLIALSQAQERAAKGHADQAHPDVSTSNGGVHVPNHLVAVTAIAQPPADTDSHPNDPRQEHQNVNRHAFVVAQHVLDPLEGIGSAGNRVIAVGDACESSVGRLDVESLLGRFGRVESRRGRDGGNSLVGPGRRRPDDPRDVKGGDDVAEPKGRVDHHPSKQRIGTIVVIDALEGVYDRRGVEAEGDDQVGCKRCTHDLAEHVAALAACLIEVRAGKLYAFACLGTELADGFAKNGRHVGKIPSLYLLFLSCLIILGSPFLNRKRRSSVVVNE